MQRGLGDLRDRLADSLRDEYRLTRSRRSTAQSHGAHFVVGVDIDTSLIEAAWRRRIAVWSMQAPTTGRSNDGPTGEDEGNDEGDDSPPAKKRRRETDTRTVPHASYFPASCEHELGPLPIPPAAHRGKTTFPHNIAFRAADWPAAPIPEDAAGYDVVVGCVCFFFISTRERVRA